MYKTFQYQMNWQVVNGLRSRSVVLGRRGLCLGAEKPEARKMLKKMVVSPLHVSIMP
jgi:hypothetical protein